MKYLLFITCTIIEEKQLNSVSYLFELVYNLIISPEDNVLNSPGFEIHLAIYGGPGNKSQDIIIYIYKYNIWLIYYFL